ncbi:MAG: hypothetical protein WCW13_04135 [archaeon]
MKGFDRMDTISIVIWVAPLILLSMGVYFSWFEGYLKCWAL